MTESNNDNNKSDNNLEAALDILQTTTRLHKHSLPMPPVASPNPQSPDLSTMLTGKPLELAKSNPNPADAQATKVLLDAYHREDGWHCPRCNLVTTNPTTFAQHLIDEFNRAFADVARLRIESHRAATTRPPKPDKR